MMELDRHYGVSGKAVSKQKESVQSSKQVQTSADQ